MDGGGVTMEGFGTVGVTMELMEIVLEIVLETVL